MTSAAPRAAFALIGSTSEANAVIARLLQVMDAMLAVIEQETALVRAGKLSAAAHLAPGKTELAQLYLTDTQRLKAGKNFLRQTGKDVLDALRTRHERVQAAVQTNLTVLATAHAVSEGIMRGVSERLARKSMPETYGASGRTAEPSARQAPALTLSRIL
ncbi:MAG TPA: hypothetical protein VNK48_09395 [Xanthobacteraceae bacterium]|nr:hypothetical protein [Xanthobacteraceae bacterium]